MGITKSEISTKTVSVPTEVNFQPIPEHGGSISIAETVFDSYQGLRTLRNQWKRSETIRSSEKTPSEHVSAFSLGGPQRQKLSQNDSRCLAND